MENTNIQLFEKKQVRSVWDEEQEKWFFSVQDMVGILTESTDVKQYIKRLLSRDESLKLNWGTICTLVEMLAADGKKRKIQASDTKGLLRIIQSIPSKKAEPFKIWLAQVGSDRLDEIQDPELSINKAMQDYLNLGYSENWINQRLKSIEVRKELTDEWKRLGVKEGQQFATLTDIITKGWSDKNTKDYKKFKGLKKENLRDNMTNTELILNMLAEASTKDISQAVSPETFDENKEVAKQGGNVAKVARLELESKTGKKVVTNLSAKKLLEEKQSKKLE